MDIVTKNLLKTFRAEESLPSDITEDILFEHFANFCILAKEYSEEFSLDDIHTGEGGDMAIDGIAVLVNGNLIANADEIDDLAQSNKYIEAEFVFVQAKSASKFDGADISNFLFGVRDMFNPNSRMPKGAKVKEKIDLINSIYEKPACLEKQLQLLRKFETNLEYGKQGADWLNLNITDFAKSMGKYALSQCPSVQKAASVDMIDDFYFSIEQLLERISHCLIWGRYSILDSFDIPLIFDQRTHEIAFSFFQETIIPSRLPTEVRKQIHDYVNYLVKRLPLYSC